MTIDEYLKTLNQEGQAIFAKALGFTNELGSAHHYSACLYDFSECITDESEKKIIRTVSAQLESATLTASFGMYRQAFASLRLALEMGLAVSYFSVHRLDLHEWIKGRADIKWSSIVDENCGVFSRRFAKAFFEEFINDIEIYRTRATTVYRKLSEFVHGNFDTWNDHKIELSFKEDLLNLYFEYNKEVNEIILFVLSCRYLRSFSDTTIESLDFIANEFSHIDYLREFFGGPK